MMVSSSFCSSSSEDPGTFFSDSLKKVTMDCLLAYGLWLGFFFFSLIVVVTRNMLKTENRHENLYFEI